MPGAGQRHERPRRRAGRARPRRGSGRARAVIATRVRPARWRRSHPAGPAVTEVVSGEIAGRSRPRPYCSPMRTDWVPLSASALVIGAMSLVFGSLLNPAEAGATTAETLRVVERGQRPLAGDVGDVLLRLGRASPSACRRCSRCSSGAGRKLGLIARARCSRSGAIGTCGYAMLHGVLPGDGRRRRDPGRRRSTTSPRTRA